jgi:hypothetical protein
MSDTPMTFAEFRAFVMGCGIVPQPMELPGHAYGATGYIDGLKPADLSSPVCEGTDRHGRPFMAFRLAVVDGNGKEKMVVETAFQRHSDCIVPVTTGGSSVLCSEVFRNHDRAWLRRVFTGEDAGIKVVVGALEDFDLYGPVRRISAAPVTFPDGRIWSRYWGETGRVQIAH